MGYNDMLALAAILLIFVGGPLVFAIVLAIAGRNDT